MENVFIKYNCGFSWNENDNVIAIGYAFSNNNYLNSKGITNFIADYKPHSFSDFKKAVIQLSGSFSVIFKHKNSYFLYSDISRFFPLFYSEKQGIYKISDSPDNLCNKNISISGVKEMLKFGYTLFDNTIWENVKQVEAGYAVELSEEGINKKRLFRYDTTKYSNSTKIEIKKEISEELNRVGQIYTNSLNNKQVILPLSGGLDSRYIAAFLKQNNYTNVVCFTYGNDYNREVEKSKHVAHSLGFDWYFIKNSGATPIDISDDDFQQYYKFGTRGVSFFHMHEYHAIRKLKEMNLVDSDAIVLSGYAGDLIAGSQLIKSALPWSNKNSIQKATFKLNFQGINDSEYSFYDFKKSHNSFFNYFDKKTKPISIFEHWFMQEKVPKTTFNAGFLYTFSGFEVRFPFWDSKLINTFRKVPVKYRINENLYYVILKEELFDKYNITFSDDLDGIMIKNIKQAIKRKLHYFKKPQKCDLSNNKLLAPLIKQMNDENLIFTDNVSSDDGMYLQWYLHQEIKNANNKKEALAVLKSFIQHT